MITDPERRGAELASFYLAVEPRLFRDLEDSGLFPPAALDMTTAVRNYADYCADANAWMLGRFVVPTCLPSTSQSGWPGPISIL